MDEFDRVAPWIELVLKEGGNTHSLADIRRAVDENKIQLMTAPHAAIMLEIIVYPNLKALRVIGAGGESNEALEEVKRFAHALPEIAKALGCSRFEWGGRPGWVRVLKELGMTSQTIMFKDVA